MVYARKVLSLLLLCGAFLFLSACGDGGSDVRRTQPSDDASLTPTQLLGKRIFEDTNLSEPRGQACASCHDAQQAFTGNNGSRIGAVSLGSRAETFGNRNAPTAMYALFSPTFGFVGEPDDQGLIEYTPTGGQFWDGHATSLAEQAIKPAADRRRDRCRGGIPQHPHGPLSQQSADKRTIQDMMLKIIFTPC